MLVFSRTTTELVKSILYTLCGGLLGLFLTSVFEWPIWARVLTIVVLMAALAMLLVVGEALRVEVDDDGAMRVFIMDRLRREIDLNNTELSIPTVRSKRGFRPLPNMILHFIDPATQKTYKLDCAPLGQQQYTELCARIRMAMHIVGKQETDA